MEILRQSESRLFGSLHRLWGAGRTLTLLLAIASFLTSCTVKVPEPPHHPVSENGKTVVVFPGGGFQIAMFLGMLEELERRGSRPDYLIGSCGGAVAAVIAKSFPSSPLRKQLIESNDFHRFLLEIDFHHNSLTEVLRVIGKSIWRTRRPGSREASLPSNFLLDVPRDLFLEGLAERFSKDGPRVVIVTSKLNSRGALYQETYFTDPETAEKIRGMPSGVKLAGIQDSLVSPLTRVETEFSPAEAMRASIAGPHYISPLELNGHHFMTGAVNLYPIELAKRLGEFVIMPYSGRLDTLMESNIFKATFGFGKNFRHRVVTGQSASFWVDISDASRFYSSYGMNPRPALRSWKIRGAVPTDYEEYLRRVRALWEYGRSRMEEAMVAVAPGSKEHIRIQ
jgi:predicted acylesterase/phospholipase RssA